jgi:hypothetical protein
MAARDPKIIQKFRKSLYQHASWWGCLVVCFGLWASAQAQVPAPSGLAQVAPYSGQVNLVWTPSAAAAAYQVSRGLWDMTNTPTPSVVATVNSPTSGYTDNQVTDGRSYQYLVAGIDASGNISNLAAAVTAIPYTVPGAVSPTVSNVHNNSLDLSWSVPLSTFPVSFYNVYHQIGGGPVSTTITASSLVASNPIPIATSFITSFSDTNPSAANPNFYCVVAVDNQGNTGSLPPSSTGGALPSNSLPPVAPSLFGFIPVAGYGTKTAGTPTATPTYGVDLVWNGPGVSEGVTNYQIYSNQTQIATVIVSPTASPTYSYIDTPIPVLSAGVPIAYSIVALNSNGSVTSNTVSENIVAPSLPGVIQVTPNATSNSVTVTWGQGVTGTYGMITDYAVYRGLNGVPVPFATPVPGMTPAPTNTPTPFMVIAETPSRTPTLVAIDTIANANGYTYWVQPVDVGTGGYIAVAAIPVLKLAPTPVSTVSASQVANTNNKITVTWSGAAPGFYGNITNYAIYRFLASTPTPTGTLTPIVTVGPTKSSRNDYVDDFSGTSASYSVGAVDSLGNVSDLAVLSNSFTLNATPSVPQMPHVIHSDQSGTSLTYNWLLNPTPDAVINYTVFGPDLVTDTITPTPIATILPTPAAVNSYTTSAPPLWQFTPYYLEASNTLGSSLPATLAVIAVPTYSVTAVAQPAQGVNVSWNAAPLPGATPPIDSFVIYRASANTSSVTFYQPIATVSSSTSTYLDVSVTPGTKYAYMVTSRSDLNGTPVAESPISVTGIAYPMVLTWPNVPTGVSANAGSNATTLSWLPNPTNDAVQSYTIYRNGTATTTITPSPTMNVVFAETPGNISSYQVAANNPGGSMGSSSITVLAVPSQTPIVALTPGSFTASNPVASVWISGLTYPVSVGGYSIYNSTDPTFAAMPTPVSTVTNPTAVISVPGQTGSINYYKVVANNGLGVNANFTLSGLMGINLWPNPPSSFLASAGQAAVTLTWSKPASGNSPVTAYAIYKGTASGLENPTPTVVSSLGSSVDAQVTPGVTYYYYMNSISDDLYSLLTGEQAALPGQTPILNGVAMTNQVILTWSPVAVAASSPITEYIVRKIAVPTPGAVINSAPTTTINSMPLTATTFTDSSVFFNYGYIYSVVPIGFTSSGATIYGPYSNSVTLTAPPQAPTSVVAVSGDQVVQLRWNYLGSAVTTYNYSIQRKLGTAPVTAYQTIASGLAGLDYTDTGLLDKTLYNYEVLVSSAGLTGVSQPVNALPAKPPVVDNPNLTLNQTQNGNVISWTAANSNPGDYVPATMYPLGGYSIYRSSDGGGSYQLLASQGVGLLSYTDQVSIINGAAYTYVVYAYDAPPNVNTSNSSMVHETTYNTVTATGLSASTALDRNSLRPFGSSNEQVVDIRFVVTSAGNVQIKVYSLSGTFIKQLVNQNFGIGVYGGVGDPNPVQWDGRNANGNLVASGVYLITTEMNGLQQIDKIAVIK